MTAKKKGNKETNEYFIPINDSLAPHMQFGQRVLSGVIDKIIEDGATVVTGAFTPKDNLDKLDRLDAKVYVIDENDEFWDLENYIKIKIDVNAQWKKEDKKK